MGKIAEVQEVTLTKLVPYVNNAKIHSEKQVTMIASSIREFGFLSPVLIDRDFNIIAGHGRVMAAKKLDMESVPCVFVEGLTEAQRKAYILADNRLGELADWDMDLVNMELEALNDMDFDVSLTGFEMPEEKETYSEPEEDEFEDIEKFDTHYGVCYQGNKSRIADIIIHILPEGNRLVDLFGGGGAITHCAMLSDKWHEFLYNDLNEMITGLFIDAVYGKYHDEHRVITREEFNDLKDTDAYVKYIWSFGNNGRSYLFSEELEPQKRSLHNFVVFGVKDDFIKTYFDDIDNFVTDTDIHSRRRSMRKYMVRRNAIRPHWELEQLRNIERLQQLERLERLQINNGSYLDYPYKDGDVVYCDPPYEGTDKSYGIVFDHKQFYDWAASRPYQVFFSSYQITDNRFKIIWQTPKQNLFNSGSGQFTVTEFLYTNKTIKSNRNDPLSLFQSVLYG